MKGRLTYMAVWSGCHTYDARLIWPPAVTTDWIANPAPKR
jgi:hypothetical protein